MGRGLQLLGEVTEHAQFFLGVAAAPPRLFSLSSAFYFPSPYLSPISKNCFNATLHYFYPLPK